MPLGNILRRVPNLKFHCIRIHQPPRPRHVGRSQRIHVAAFEPFHDAGADFFGDRFRDLDAALPRSLLLFARWLRSIESRLFAAVEQFGNRHGICISGDRTSHVPVAANSGENQRAPEFM
ncbi:MAG TPA: hypothetical protein VKX17_18930 [Planctomycetota bacterium]|nr:hypothetical protein [Planctomycetota bacterium]